MSKKKNIYKTVKNRISIKVSLFIEITKYFVLYGSYNIEKSTSDSSTDFKKEGESKSKWTIHSYDSEFQIANY